jgi:hypothetical protein
VAAGPREAGTSQAEAAREQLERWLVERGFQVQRQPFSFQPAVLIAFPLLGAGLGWLAILQLPLLLTAALPAWVGPILWLSGLVALGALAWGIGSGVSVPGAERRVDANLIARPPGEAPVARWIVAHLDTKAQGHSMAGRLVAVWVMALAVAGFTVIVVWRAWAGTPLPAAPVAGAAGLVIAAGILAGRGRLRGGSPGARDNGTGLYAALVAAQEGPRAGVGFLFTGAEEFGLVGARALLAGGLGVRGLEVVNLDTIADRGHYYAVTHDAASRPLAERLLAGLAGPGAGGRVRGLPPGVFVDSLPLARAGARAVTLARLDWSVLALIHTPRDTLVGLDLASARRVGERLGALPAPS